ncbi:aspartate aminotransferase family protein [Micromonospora sp. WMMD1120]|uniref:class-III pyridoxal-phosphate-dependent aminotransferase n=1 Tax=Micromonospora sp. WMMD1120 TaxID=3016106 RepID=UPI0024180E2B|nr:aspartate aminotransferase family protein [Micromonospora sp. WMMD1120]MDG4807546.1 aspartate aminotransferase family protein [Micromonospora sp. WMMD1120]
MSAAWDVGTEPGAVAAACKATTLFEWVAQDGYQPLEIVSAEGSAFRTADGRRVLDFASQLVVTNLGHSLEPIHRRVYEASRELSYVTPLAATRQRAELGARLTAFLPDHLTKVFLSTSGTEANNDAIRIARAVTGRQHILYRGRSYHGSQGPAAMSSDDDRRRLWEQEPTYSVPFRAGSGVVRDDVAAFRWAVEALAPRGIAAAVVEAVPGGSGVLVPADGYLDGVAEVCREHGILLICDEVLTGFGRTGRRFAFEHWDLRPDLVTVGKALSAGVAPIAAVAVSAEIAARFDDTPFGSGHTFSGHPLTAVAASAALEEYERTGAVERAAKLGDVLGRALHDIADRADAVAEARSIGLLGALELTDAEAPRLRHWHQRLLDAGVFVIAKGANLIVAPPLVIDNGELDEGLAVTARVLAG